MILETAFKLIVALARMAEIPPELLAEYFNDEDGCQKYFDQLVAASNGENDAYNAIAS